MEESNFETFFRYNFVPESSERSELSDLIGRTDRENLIMRIWLVEHLLKKKFLLIARTVVYNCIHGRRRLKSFIVGNV